MKKIARMSQLLIVKHMIQLVLALSITLSSTSAFSADSTSSHESRIFFIGFFDLYYSKNFNSPTSQTNQLRNFDVYENQFALNLVKLIIGEQAEPVGFRIDVALGPTNDIVQGIAPYGTNAHSTLSNLEQAYVTAVLPIGSGLTVDVGKFVTLMGFEVIESNANWNYSRSLLFSYAIPYYHTGLRVAYSSNDNFSISMHIVNGWNSVIDNNSSKSVGLALSYSPNSNMTVTFNGMSGFEQTRIGALLPVKYGKKNLVELIATNQITSQLYLALDANYGEERVAGSLDIWKGLAMYCKYLASSNSYFALRGEVFYDPSTYTTGVTFSRATFKEVTVTYEHTIFRNLSIYTEFRDDIANGNAFVGSDPVLPTRSTQPTLLLGVVSTF